VVRVTGNFQSESPLHPKAFDVLHAAFDSGWADPAKLSQSGAKARQLKNNALESIATSLLVEVDSIVAVSPTSLGYFLGIQGLFLDSPTLIHGATDRKDVFAIAAKISHHVLKSALDGKFIPSNTPAKKSVLALQIAKLEDKIEGGVAGQVRKILAESLSKGKIDTFLRQFGIKMIDDESIEFKGYQFSPFSQLINENFLKPVSQISWEQPNAITLDTYNTNGNYDQDGHIRIVDFGPNNIDEIIKNNLKDMNVN
jgi:cysteine desulfurase